MKRPLILCSALPLLAWLSLPASGPPEAGQPAQPIADAPRRTNHPRPLSSPPPGPHPAGSYWISSLGGGTVSTYDALYGTSNLGYVNCTVYKWVIGFGGVGSWIAGSGYPVTFSCAFLAPGGWSYVWNSSAGSNAPPSWTTNTGAGGIASSSFQYIADPQDQSVVYSADCGASQLNRNETVYASGGGDHQSIHHTRFAAGDSHADCLYPPAGHNVPATGFSPVWCGLLQDAQFPPSSVNAFRLYAELLTAGGAVAWRSDTSTDGGHLTPTTKLFTANGQHRADISQPTGDLVAYRGQDLTLHVAVQRSSYGVLTGWDPWHTIRNNNEYGSILIEAKSACHLQ